ncbi:MAG: OmpA family protein [Candidatus Kapaibacterium sp.]
MRFIDYIGTLSLLLALSVSGCVPSVRMPERARLECPEPPPPPCLPGKFAEVTIDTSSSASGRSSHYLTISQVQGLNGADDEYAVAFPSAGTGGALATIRPHGARDQLHPVGFRRVNQAAVEENISVPAIASSYGGAARTSSRSDTLLFAARQSGTVSGDYDLFSGDYGNGTLTSVLRQPISGVVTWEAQPALSRDGRTLYFAADRSGGMGGTDIYVAHRGADGRWSAPVNVGSGVNSACDELSPFVSGDGQWLYFSSSGHETVGGYDLFRAPIAGDQIGGAENLGAPINTIADEIFPSAPADASPDTLLYYSSNQRGSQGFDIYVLYRLKRPGGSKGTPQTLTLNGTVRTSDGKPVDSAKVTLEQRDPPGDVDSTITNSDGKYKFQVEEGKRYDLIAGSDSTLFVRDEVRIPLSDGRRTLTHDIVISDTVTFRVNFPFNNATDPYEFTLDEHGMPTDLQWVRMIDRAADFLKGFPRGSGNKFLLVGHTDPVGTDPFNLDLGRRRAEFIRSELVKRGVSPSILEVRTEGESRPLPMRDGEGEDLYHARLRRVELIRH